MSLPETRLKHPFSMSDVRLTANEEIVYHKSRVPRKGVFWKKIYPPHATHRADEAIL